MDQLEHILLRPDTYIGSIERSQVRVLLVIIITWQQQPKLKLTQ
jgi:DNA gyrase/topoisomerase IV subunit B